MEDVVRWSAVLERNHVWAAAEGGGATVAHFERDGLGEYRLALFGRKCPDGLHNGASLAKSCVFLPKLYPTFSTVSAPRN